MDALGYASNRKPFRDLARRVPITSLVRLRREPPTTRLLALKALLIGAAGLMTHVKPDEEARRLKRLRKHLHGPTAMSQNRWRLFRVRPANHPVTRIAGAAHLVERYMEKGLVRGLEQAVAQGRVGCL